MDKSFDDINTKYPLLYKLVAGEKIDEDIQWARELANSNDNYDLLKQAIEGRVFNLPDVINCLGAETIWPWKYSISQEIEQNLRSITDALGFDEVIAAFRLKLLIGARSEFEDTRYEIAVAAKACQILDVGTVKLEANIHNSNKNSDILGAYEGNTVRIEVTVLHDNWFSVDSSSTEKIIEEADINTGFILRLKKDISGNEAAQSVKDTLEKLYWFHKQTTESDQAENSNKELNFTIASSIFKWEKGAYRVENNAYIQSIVFDLDRAQRFIEHPMLSMSMTPQYIEDENTQPEGVVTFSDVPKDPDTHRKIPETTRVFQKVEVKLRQCEDGVCNIIALGQNYPMYDSSVRQALFGVETVAVPFHEDENGRRNFQHPVGIRDNRGPFTQKSISKDPDQFIVPFQKLSALWLIRLDSPYIHNLCHVNPNASNPLSNKLINLLNNAFTKNDSSSKARPHKINTPSTLSPEKIEPENEQPPMSPVEFIMVCGGKEKAIEILQKIRSRRDSLVDLQSKLNSATNDFQDNSLQRITLSDEQLAFQFILDCGDVVSAIEMVKST